MKKVKKKIRTVINFTKDFIIPPKKRFNEIYQKNYWGDSESISGPGSRLEATETLRNELKILFNKFKIKSLVDAPCGDFNWMKLVDLEGVDYTGVDIVDDIISNNIKLYANSHKNFYCKNFISEIVPQGDLILCRDCLPHFSNYNVKKAINNFILSDSTYLLTSSYPECSENLDIITGEWRKINFNIKPFNFPKPLYVINEKSPLTLENGQNFDKYLYLYKLSDLKEYI